MFNEYNLFVQSYQLAEKVLVSLYNSFYDMRRLNRDWAVVMVCDHSRRPIHNVFIWNDKGKTGRDEDQALDYRWCNCILDVASLLFYFKLVDIIITPNKSCQICSSTIFRIICSRKCRRKWWNTLMWIYNFIQLVIYNFS